MNESPDSDATSDAMSTRRLGVGPAWQRWVFGQWDDLVNAESVQRHDRADHVALLRAAARLQRHEIEPAEADLQEAVSADCDRNLVVGILLSGALNSLGRAHALSAQPDQAWECFQQALRLVPLEGDSAIWARARADSESRRLGLPPVAPAPSGGTTQAWRLPDWLRAGLKEAPESPPLLIAAAERAQRSGDLDYAIRYWQRLAAVEGSSMEQAYYDRLEQAYSQLAKFPTGSAEEETLRGDIDKHQVLKRIHQLLRPRSYLEIGIQHGRSLALAECPSIGIDPMPMVTVRLPDRARIARATSDHFFEELAPSFISGPVDFVFIDGMHLFEFALRDFMNVERYAGPQTLVVIDDIFPNHPAQAARDRCTRAWTGDVWKLLPVLRQYRPELSLLRLDAYPTGLLCISGLDPGNVSLNQSYAAIVGEWSHNMPVPDDVLSRAGALPCNHPGLETLLDRLRTERSVM
jgi:tetratricopeptide (TPR) repeat protein